MFSSHSSVFAWVIGSLMALAAIRKIYLWKKRRQLFGRASGHNRRNGR